jgi:hypothetical protein
MDTKTTHNTAKMRKTHPGLDKAYLEKYPNALTEKFGDTKPGAQTRAKLPEYLQAFYTEPSVS